MVQRQADWQSALFERPTNACRSRLTSCRVSLPRGASRNRAQHRGCENTSPHNSGVHVGKHPVGMQH